MKQHFNFSNSAETAATPGAPGINSAPRDLHGAQQTAPRRWRLGFWSLIVTQFQGAFNDNGLKFLVIYLIVDMGLLDTQRDWLVLVIGALFALPYILFSMTGGALASRYSKRSVTIGTKWMEVGAMLFVVLALARGNIVMESVGVFLISSQGALFGPSKYGLLPEILPEEELSWGNGVIELGTFLAVIAATVAAGYLAYYFRGRQIWSGLILLGCTFLGLATSHAITRVPAASPERRLNLNPLGDLLTQIKLIRADRILSWAVVGNTYLWFLAALLQFTIVIYGHDILRIDDRHISYLQAAVAIGIGFGSLAAGYLSDGKIEYGLIPLGAVGMTIFGFLSAGQGLSFARAATYIGLLCFFGGFYAVPLNALIQHRPDPRRGQKEGIIAAANLLSFVGVFLAAGAYFVLAQGLHLRADKIFFAGACMTLAATFYAVVLLPHSMLRLGLWFLTHTFYSIRVQGRANIPERGAALFVIESATTLETMLLTASIDRTICFVLPGTNGGASRSFMQRALRITRSAIDGMLPAEIEDALRAGEVVCATGDTVGLLLQRYAGTKSPLEKTSAESHAPIVAVSLRGTSNGILRSANDGLSLQKPSKLPARLTVRFAPPLPPTASQSEISRALAALSESP